MTKRNISIATVFLVSLTSITWCQQPAAKLLVQFFGSPTCGECLELKETILEPIAKEYSGKIDLRIYNIEDSKDYLLLDTLEKRYKVTQSSPQELFLPDTFLLGFESIKKNGRQLIQSYLDNPQKWIHTAIVVDTNRALHIIKQRFQKFTFLSILIAGLFDGINPCAIATIIFLISFLATQKRSRGQILAVGMAFTLTVFVTYLLMGVGAFKVLTMFEKYRWVSQIIRWLAVIAAAVFSVLSFRDAYVYSRTKKAADVALQLPKAVKLRIHKIISENITGSRLIIGTIIAAFLVTLLEAICTGQMYLPTIILMTQQKGLKLVGWLYLVFYNILFVLPLLIIMVLAYFGLTWSQLSKSSQKYLPIMKILLGIAMAGLAIFLVVAG